MTDMFGGIRSLRYSKFLLPHNVSVGLRISNEKYSLEFNKSVSSQVKNKMHRTANENIVSIRRICERSFTSLFMNIMTVSIVQDVSSSGYASLV